MQALPLIAVASAQAQSPCRRCRRRCHISAAASAATWRDLRLQTQTAALTKMRRSSAALSLVRRLCSAGQAPVLAAAAGRFLGGSLSGASGSPVCAAAAALQRPAWRCFSADGSGSGGGSVPGNSAAWEAVSQLSAEATQMAEEGDSAGAKLRLKQGREGRLGATLRQQAPAEAGPGGFLRCRRWQPRTLASLLHVKSCCCSCQPCGALTWSPALPEAKKRQHPAQPLHCLPLPPCRAASPG